MRMRLFTRLFRLQILLGVDMKLPSALAILVASSVFLVSCGGGSGQSSDQAMTSTESEGIEGRMKLLAVPATWVGRKPKISIINSSFDAGSKPEYQLIGLGGSTGISVRAKTEIRGIAYSRGDSRVVSAAATINGVVVPNFTIDEQGGFRFFVDLVSGSNSIGITVRSANGLETSRTHTIVYDQFGLISIDLELSDDKLGVGVSGDFGAAIKIAANASPVGSLELIRKSGEIVAKLLPAGEGWYKSSFNVLGARDDLCMQVQGKTVDGKSLLSGTKCIRAFSPITIAQVNQSLNAERILNAAFNSSRSFTTSVDRALKAVSYVNATSDATLFSAFVVDREGDVRYTLASGYNATFKYVPDAFLGGNAIAAYPQVSTTVLASNLLYPNTAHIAASLEESVSTQTFPQRRRKVSAQSVGDLIDSEQNGIVNILTHGGVYNGLAYLDTMVPVVDVAPYLSDIAMGDVRVAASRNTLMVSARYLRKLLKGRSFSNSVVILTACRSAVLPDFQLLFTELGASAVLGYDNIVPLPAGVEVANSLLKLFSEGKGLKASFAEIKSRSISLGVGLDVWRLINGKIYYPDVNLTVTVSPVLYLRPDIDEVLPPSTQDCGTVTSPGNAGQQGPFYFAVIDQPVRFTTYYTPIPGASVQVSHLHWSTSPAGVEANSPTQSAFSPTFTTAGTQFVSVNPVLVDGTMCTNVTATSQVSVYPTFSLSIPSTGLNAAGEKIAQGQTDPHWKVVSGLNITTPLPAVSSFVSAPYYRAAPASWIWVNSNGGGGINQPYAFEREFDIGNADPNSIMLTGKWAADNFGAIYINGIPAIGTGRIVLPPGDTNNLPTANAFTITTGFKSGINTISFRVTDTGNPGGLLAWDLNVAPKSGQSGLLNPSNGHRYEILQCGTWMQCRDAAKAMGGKLATIRSPAENQWIATNLLPLATSVWGFWIGYNDRAIDGFWIWDSGEDVTYTNWSSWYNPNPNNEDAAHMVKQWGGSWNDTPASDPGITQALIEYQ